MKREKLRRWKSACIITIVIVTLLIAPVIAFGATQNVTENVTEPSNVTAPNITENITDTDTTAPIITVLSPENATYNTTAINLNYTINEPTDWIGYSLNGANNVTIMGNLTFNASEGLNDLVVYARDTTSNVGKAEVQFNVNLVVTVENITDVPPPTAAESSTVTPKLTAKKDSFTLAEEPAFSFEYNPFNKSFIKNASQLKKWVTDNETIEAFVYDSYGKLTDIEPEIEELSGGEFSIKLPKERAFRAGLYKLSVELVRDERVCVVEREFPWGLVSLNTRKSIYKPGETAEFIIVVLDKDGHPVSDADISMTITNPYDEKTTYSTGDGTILPGEECGLYNVDYLTEVEGNHTIDIIALISGIEVNFSTHFLVKQDYAFDIVRTAQSKIDPTRQDRFVVTIDLESFTDAESVTIKEFVPAEFDVSPTDAATVLLEDDTKTITWNDDLIDKRTSVSYSYSVPAIWPYLYALGPAEIDYDSKSFTEARPWYVAVDPTTETLTVVYATGVSTTPSGDVTSEIQEYGGSSTVTLPDGSANYVWANYTNIDASSVSAVTVLWRVNVGAAQDGFRFEYSVDDGESFSACSGCDASVTTGQYINYTCDLYANCGIDTPEEVNGLAVKIWIFDEHKPGSDSTVDYSEVNVTYTGYATTLQIRDQAASQNITSITVSGISGEIATDPYNDVNGSSSPQNTSTNTPVATIYNPAGNPASLISLKVDAGAGWTDVISDEKFNLTDDNTDPGAESTWTSLTPWSTYIDSGVTVNADEFKDLYLSFTLTGSPGTGTATIWVLAEV